MNRAFQHIGLSADRVNKNATPSHRLRLLGQSPAIARLKRKPEGVAVLESDASNDVCIGINKHTVKMTLPIPEPLPGELELVIPEVPVNRMPMGLIKFVSRLGVKEFSLIPQKLGLELKVRRDRGSPRQKQSAEPDC